MKDSFNRDITYLRLSITDLCNLRCRYCMPEDGLTEKKCHQDMMHEEDMIKAVEAAASLGIKKLRITGGEPLVKKNIVSICEKSAAVPGIEEIAMTTNAVLLPKYAEAIHKAGVSRLNISLDTLDPEKFARITRIGKLEDVMAGIHKALEIGFRKIKINAVLIGGFNDDEIPALAELSRKYPIDVRFIELMPMVDGEFGPAAYVPCSEVLKQLPDLIPVEKDGGVAALYRFPDGKGHVGLISPVSQHFCGECNRIRITADGKVKPCLHSNAEYSLKDKSVEEMKEVLKDAIWNKPAYHEPLSATEMSNSGRSMNQIGG